MFFSIIILVLSSISTVSFQDLKDFEVQIENAVVKGNIDFLEKVYSDDFVFTHGTGTVQNKEQWLDVIRKTYENSVFISRMFEAQKFELHVDVAITKGKLIVKRKNDKPYWIEYIRVYRKHKQFWQMISHHTINSNF